MSILTDQHYLKSDQYKDGSNLDARLELHRRFSTNSYGWFNWVFDTLERLPAHARILELGCGPAYLWKECINRIPAGWNITLSDLSPGMLDAAWRNLVVSGRNFKFKEIDAQSIPYEAETFDAVIANHMLYHVPDRPKAFSEIERVLRPGGCLIAATCGERHLEEMNEWMKRVSLRPFEKMTDMFTLENGLSQLTPFFSRVNVARYPDDLRVKEVEPVLAYIRSSVRAAIFSPDELLRLKQDLEKELQEKGHIFIHKDSGLFEAIK